MLDEWSDLISFAESVDRWLLTLAGGEASSEKAALDEQAEQVLGRDDLRTLLESALQDVPLDVFAIASRLIIALVPSAAAGTLPLSLDPPLVAAMALRIARMTAATIDHASHADIATRSRSTDVRSQAHWSQHSRASRRRRRRWSIGAACVTFGFRKPQVEPQMLEPPLGDQRASGQLVDVALRPKRWYCIACGWRCNQSYNDYLCDQCGAIRPFVGGSATMMQCRGCKQWNLALARFCEWCGVKL